MASLLAKQRLGIAIGLAAGVAATLGLVALLPGGGDDGPTPSVAARKIYTGRQGDELRVPAAATHCLVSQEGGFPNLFCSRISGGRLQVVFYSDRVQVWRSGDPDGPIFSAPWEP